jgi:hypothetical protein
MNIFKSIPGAIRGFISPGINGHQTSPSSGLGHILFLLRPVRAFDDRIMMWQFCSEKWLNMSFAVSSSCAREPRLHPTLADGGIQNQQSKNKHNYGWTFGIPIYARETPP